MYKLILKDKEFEFPTNIGAIKRIEGEFKKPILRIVEGVEDFTMEDYTKILKSVLSKEDKEAFKVYSEDLCYIEMSEIFQEFINKLFYGNMSKEEIEEKKLKQMEEYKKIKELN